MPFSMSTFFDLIDIFSRLLEPYPIEKQETSQRSEMPLVQL